tara:strand:+ start:39301 stop:39531 length:231 start_codon:yes stop_codon:yes gene_type:complete
MSDKRNDGIAKQLMFRAPGVHNKYYPEKHVYTQRHGQDTIIRPEQRDASPYWRQPLTNKHTDRSSRKSLVPMRDDD